MDEITVIRAGALGDVVLALPALSALRTAFPRARLRAVGYPANWAVAGTLVDEVRSIDDAAMAGLLSDVPGDAPRKVLGSSDLVVAWTKRDPAAALQRAGGQQVVHAPPLPPPGIHAATWLLQSLAGLEDGRDDRALPTVDLDYWRIAYSDAELLEGGMVLERLGLRGAVLMHPGAGAVWKRWPAERFASVGIALDRQGLRVALLQGPADREAVAAVQAHAAQPFPVLPLLPARMLGAVLAQAPSYLGNDSGVTHLAAASGAPTVALFGPTDPAAWGPLGRSIVLRHCTAPSHTGGGIRVCNDPACLEAISVDDVIAALTRSTVQKHVENRGQSR